jgi:hypothetical protein
MKKHGLLHERHTGRRRPREHDGQVTTIRDMMVQCFEKRFDAIRAQCNGSPTVTRKKKV